MKRLDNYQLEIVLGKGYSGQVYLAKQVETSQKYAIKILNKRIPNYLKLVKDTQKEAIILQQINQPSVVQIIDFQINGKMFMGNNMIEDNVCYVVLELAENGEIFDIIFETGPLKGDCLIYYMWQLINVFSYLHSNNIAHRDIKPENILLDSNCKIKLADFGFATILDEGQRSWTVLGTERYMSPEILSSKSYDAKKADIFSLGVVFYVLAKGNPPFIKSDIQKDPYYKTLIQNPRHYWLNMDDDNSVDEDLRQIIISCLQHNPEQRPTAEQLLNMNYFKKAIDEQEIILQMRKKVQQTKFSKQQKVLQQQIELQSGQYRNSLQNNKEEIMNNFLLLKKCKAIKLDQQISGTENFNILLEGKQEQILTVFAGLVEELPTKIPIKISIKENEEAIKLNCIYDQDQQIDIEILLFEISVNQFGVKIIKESGDSFDFYQIKNEILQELRRNS